MATELVYDDLPTGEYCSHCRNRAKWWVSKTLGHRTRRYNLCDLHFARSLRDDGGLNRLIITLHSEVRAETSK